MKRVYYYVGQEKPVHELYCDTWGLQYLYLKDSLEDAIRSQGRFHRDRRKGERLYRIFRLSFTEVPRRPDSRKGGRP